LTQTLTKISLFLGLIILIVSCDAVKHIPKDKHLLTKNTIIIDSTVNNEFKVKSLIYQQPNAKVLGIPLSLHFYNLANPKPDSTFLKWQKNKPNREKRMNNIYSKKQVDKIASSYTGFNRWIQKTGKEPTIIDEKILKKNIKYINNYYSSFGWFNTESSYKIDTIESKRASVTYFIKRQRPYLIGSIEEELSSPVVDSLFQIIKDKSLVIKDHQYSSNDFNNERERITRSFRNSGLFYFFYLYYFSFLDLSFCSFFDILVLFGLGVI